jgi:hypothetical protein
MGRTNDATELLVTMHSSCGSLPPTRDTTTAVSPASSIAWTGLPRVIVRCSDTGTEQSNRNRRSSYRADTNDELLHVNPTSECLRYVWSMNSSSFGEWVHRYRLRAPAQPCKNDVSLRKRTDELAACITELAARLTMGAISRYARRA